MIFDCDPTRIDERQGCCTRSRLYGGVCMIPLCSLARFVRPEWPSRYFLVDAYVACEAAGLLESGGIGGPHRTGICAATE